MAIIAGQQIKKNTSGSIIGCINYFNERMNAAFKSATYSSSNLPKFNAGEQIAPTNQFDSIKTSNLQISDTVVTASSLWLAMRAIANLANVRLFHGYRYYNNKGTQNLTESKTNLYGAFQRNMPEATGYTREGTANIKLNLTQPAALASGKIASAASVNAAIDECYNRWQNEMKNNALTYRLYTCHSNCHQQCHSNRGRR